MNKDKHSQNYTKIQTRNSNILTINVWSLNRDACFFGVSAIEVLLYMNFLTEKKFFGHFLKNWVKNHWLGSFKTHSTSLPPPPFFKDG